MKRERRRARGLALQALYEIDSVGHPTEQVIARHLDETHGLKVAPSTVWRLLDRRGLTFKKNRARQRTTAP